MFLHICIEQDYEETLKDLSSTNTYVYLDRLLLYIVEKYT